MRLLTVPVSLFVFMRIIKAECTGSFFLFVYNHKGFLKKTIYGLEFSAESYNIMFVYRQCGGTMKKRQVKLLCAAAILSTAVTAGCGKENEKPQEEVTPGTELGDGEMMLTSEEDEQIVSIMYQYAETEEYPELADFLISYYEIPEEFQPETRYYYNFIDLNDDGAEEIFAVVVGDYTSGSGGDSAVILKKEPNGALSVMESFVFFHTPVIISDKVTNGWHEIIYPVYGGGIDPGYIICHYSEEGGYQTEANEVVEELPEDIRGIRILSNNLIDDMDKGNYLTLVPQVDASLNTEE